MASSTHSTLAQRTQPGASAARASSASGWNDETTASAGAGPRSRGKDPRDLGAGDDLQLDVEEGTRREGGKDIRQGRDAVPGQLGRGRVCHDGRDALDAFERVVVDDDRHAVGGDADVELDAVAPRRAGAGHQRGEAVLRQAAVIAAVGQAAGRHPRRTWATRPTWSDG